MARGDARRRASVRAILKLRTGCNRVVKRVQGAGNLVQGMRRAEMHGSVPATLGLCKRGGRTPVNGVPATGGWATAYRS